MLDERALLDAALAERARATRGAPSGPDELALFRHITPAVQARVYRTLATSAPSWLKRDAQATVQDLTQQVLCGLFENDARVLRAWDPTRADASSLRGWVGGFASLRVKDQIRLRGHFDWTHIPSEDAALDRASASDGPDAQVEAQTTWARIRDTVLARQSELGKKLFRLLIEDERSNSEIATEVTLSDDAIYQWRRRLREEVRATWLELQGLP